MDPEHEIEVVTPAVAADNEAARLEVMRLLAEMGQWTNSQPVSMQCWK